MRHPAIGYVLQRFILLFIYLAPLTDSQFGTQYAAPSVFTQQPTAGSPEVQGNMKVLLCQATGFPPPVYRWTKDGVFITPQNVTDTSLKIQDIQRDDAGEYQCVASNPYGAILSNRVNVHVAYMVPFEASSVTTDIRVQEGLAAEIPLPKINSYPTPTIQWFEGTQLIPSETQRYHITLDRNLVILETKLYDSRKTFKARAQNSYMGQSSSSQQFMLNVQNAPGGQNLVIPPQIVVPPSHTTVIQGDSAVQLECVANARSLNYLNINWYKVSDTGSKQLIRADSSKYLLSIYLRRLTIKMPVTSDSGEYECEATFNRPGDPAYPAARASANLTVLVAPSFATPPPAFINKDYGSSVDIPCQVMGVPPPVVKWYRNAVSLDTIITANDRYSVSDTNSLQIKDMTGADSGVYQCFCHNEAGETNGATWLQVLSSPPEIKNKPQNQSVISGESARFVCESSGAPKPDISWSKVPTGMAASEEICCSTTRLQVFPTELLITSTRPEDSGQYTCNASNSQGSDAAKAFLTVLVRTKIINPPQNTSAVMSTVVTMTCGVEKDASVTVTWKWLHENRVITSGNRLEIKSDGSLVISSVRSADIGWYECRVTSVAGNDSARANLQVIEIPHPPRIISVNKNTVSDRAVDVRWNPGFDGNSPIRRFVIQYRLVMLQTWLPANDSVPPQLRVYTVKGLFPAQSYHFRMQAVNDVGSSEFSLPSQIITLPQQPPSGPPKEVAGSPRSNTSIIIVWSPPDEDQWNGQLLGYMAKFKPSGYDDNTLQYRNITDANARSYILTGLIEFTEYMIAMAAYNAKGVGVYSDYTRARTREGHPTMPPHSIVATAVSSTSIRVTWMPPNPQFIHGINQGYYIDLNNTVTAVTSRIHVPSNTSNMLGQQSTYLRNLDKFTNYTISILCYTNGGQGPSSDPVLVQTLEDVPGAVSSLKFDKVLDTSLLAIWTPPVNINGILMGYNLTYKEKNLESTIIKVPLGPSTLNYTVTGLRAKTNYTITVYARSRVGVGPPRSEDVTSGVPPVPPEPPKNVVVGSVQARSVLLQFIRGFTGYTSISQWIVEAQVGNDVTWKVIFTKEDPDASDILVEGLRPYTDYTFRIIAENVAGRSVPSEPTDQRRTNPTYPEHPPREVTVRAVNETALRVRWTPLPDNMWNGAGERRGYRVEYQLENIGDTATSVILWDQNDNSHTIGNLQEFTMYQIRVCAENQEGISDFSPVIVEQTRESVPSAGPSSVNATAISSTSIRVSWDEVRELDKNGLIRGYKVLYKRANTVNPHIINDIDNSTIMQVDLTGLLKYVQYEIRVQAYTRIGDGALSKPPVTVRTFEDVPGPPSSIYFPEVTTNTVRVQWSPPREPNGVIRGYRVSYREDGQPESGAIVDETLGPERRSFYVTNLSQAVTYIFVITARTDLGWGQDANVRVGTFLDRRLPDPPGQPEVDPRQVTDRSVFMSWQPSQDQDSPVRNYSIQMQMNSADFVSIPDYIPPTARSHTVTGLKPYTQYRFRVGAHNDVGKSEYSPTSDQITTKKAAPESPPINLKVVPHTRDSVLVTWEPPSAASWNGDSRGYQIDYRQVAQDSEWTRKFIDNASLRRTEISGMTLFKTYEYRIKAYNHYGNSQWSSATVLYMEIVPSAPPSNMVATATSSETILVTWQPPPEDAVNGDLSGYKIYYWMDGQRASSRTVGAGETSASLRDLRKWTTYHVTMLAFNAAGDGPNVTNHATAKTFEGAPGKPGEMRFVMTSLTSLNISWTPPEEPNGVLLQYQVSYRQEAYVDGESHSVQAEVNGSKTHYIATRLTENVKYLFTLKARTSVGWGEIREGNTTTGPQPGSPEQPRKPTYTMSDTSVRLRWDNGLQGASPIIGYIVQERESKVTEWKQSMRKNNPEPDAVISYNNLNPNAEYQFRVIAINSHGISAPSVPSDYVKTPDFRQSPFYQQWWFLVIVALTGLIFIIIVISLLCLTGHKAKQKKKYKESMPAPPPPLDHHIEPRRQNPQEEDGGFTSFEMRRSQRKSQRSLAKRNGVLPPYSAGPPRPSPGSVNYSNYSDDDTKTYADDSDSLTEKKSEISSSPDPSQVSDSDLETEKDVYGYPPPPPPLVVPDFQQPEYQPEYQPEFHPEFQNSYINDPVRQSWNRYQQPSNAYSYTDSEVDSSHYAPSLNGGHVIMNNMAGSRAPLPGFSSFV